MNTLARLWAAWLRWREDRRNQVVNELDRQAYCLGLHDVSQAVSAPMRLVDVLSVAARWRAELDAIKHAPGCSCSARRVVVVHDQGTYCGDDQTDLLAAAMSAVDGRGVDNPPLADATYEEKATAALDALRGERR